VFTDDNKFYTAEKVLKLRTLKGALLHILNHVFGTWNGW